MIVINSAWPKAVAGELAGARNAFINGVRAGEKALGEKQRTATMAKK